VSTGRGAHQPAALNGLHGHIDGMIEADPKVGTATIWQRLADDHSATMAYMTAQAPSPRTGAAKR
jgi:hypothetical protein